MALIEDRHVWRMMGPRLDPQAARLMAIFVRDGYEPITPPVIQPSGPFLDAVGETLRARTYIFVDPEGEELCLRPDLTIPTCRLHLARHPAGNAPARYCYYGLAFRYQPGGSSGTHPTEFRQAGVESFGAADKEREDAAVLGLTIEALGAAGLTGVQLTIGDLGLFGALLDAIAMPQRWRRRLWHHFWRRDSFRRVLMRLTSPEALKAHDVRHEVIERLDPASPADAQSLVEEHLVRSGAKMIGARTLTEITERLLAAAADAREQPLSMSTAALIDGFTLVRAPASEAVQRILDLVRPHNIDIGPALGAFKRRLELVASLGVDTQDAMFSAVFGRSLEYYTGFVFQVFDPQLGAASPIASGGRYDGLLADMGAPHRVPAVGSCLHMERLAAALDGATA